MDVEISRITVLTIFPFLPHSDFSTFPSHCWLAIAFSPSLDFSRLYLSCFSFHFGFSTRHHTLTYSLSFHLHFLWFKFLTYSVHPRVQLFWLFNCFVFCLFLINLYQILHAIPNKYYCFVFCLFVVYKFFIGLEYELQNIGPGINVKFWKTF